MVNRLLLIFLFVVGGLLYGQDLKRNPMNTGQFSRLSNAEKVNHVKNWFREGVNVHVLFSNEFADAGGRGVIPWLFEELPKYEYEYLGYRNDERLAFLTEVLIHFRENNVLTMYERYYVAGILEAKIMDYVKKYKKYDLLVKGINANIWMFISPSYRGELSEEMDKIVLAKYKAMGLVVSTN